MHYQGLAGKRIHGGTTISGTMILAELAGIKIFGTGGLGKLFAKWRRQYLSLYTGGVHRGGENSMDISGNQCILQDICSKANHSFSRSDRAGPNTGDGH